VGRPMCRLLREPDAWDIGILGRSREAAYGTDPKRHRLNNSELAGKRSDVVWQCGFLLDRDRWAALFMKAVRLWTARTAESTEPHLH